MLRDEILRLKPAWRRKPAHPPLCSVGQCAGMEQDSNALACCSHRGCSAKGGLPKL